MLSIYSKLKRVKFNSITSSVIHRNQFNLLRNNITNTNRNTHSIRSVSTNINSNHNNTTNNNIDNKSGVHNTHNNINNYHNINHYNFNKSSYNDKDHVLLSPWSSDIIQMNGNTNTTTTTNNNTNTNTSKKRIYNQSINLNDLLNNYQHIVEKIKHYSDCNGKIDINDNNVDTSTTSGNNTSTTTVGSVNNTHEHIQNNENSQNSQQFKSTYKSEVEIQYLKEHYIQLQELMCICQDYAITTYTYMQPNTSSIASTSRNNIHHNEYIYLLLDMGLLVHNTNKILCTQQLYENNMLLSGDVSGLSSIGEMYLWGCYASGSGTNRPGSGTNRPGGGTNGGTTSDVTWNWNASSDMLNSMHSELREIQAINNTTIDSQSQSQFDTTNNTTNNNNTTDNNITNSVGYHTLQNSYEYTIGCCALHGKWRSAMRSLEQMYVDYYNNYDNIDNIDNTDPSCIVVSSGSDGDSGDGGGAVSDTNGGTHNDTSNTSNTPITDTYPDSSIVGHALTQSTLISTIYALNQHPSKTTTELSFKLIKTMFHENIPRTPYVYTTIFEALTRDEFPIYKFEELWNTLIYTDTLVWNGIIHPNSSSSSSSNTPNTTLQSQSKSQSQSSSLHTHLMHDMYSTIIAARIGVYCQNGFYVEAESMATIVVVVVVVVVVVEG